MAAILPTNGTPDDFRMVEEPIKKEEDEATLKSRGGMTKVSNCVCAMFIVQGEIWSIDDIMQLPAVKFCRVVV